VDVGAMSDPGAFGAGATNTETMPRRWFMNQKWGVWWGGLGIFR
jgi:hypothetical protein